jgi:hypothetical protein
MQSCHFFPLGGVLFGATSPFAEGAWEPLSRPTTSENTASPQQTLNGNRLGGTSRPLVVSLHSGEVKHNHLGATLCVVLALEIDSM